MADSNLTSRTITGTIFIVMGLILAVVAFFSSWVILTYGVILLVLGLFILFNKKEDDIEEIKTERRKRIK